LDGNGISTIGQKGDGAGDLSLPKGVAFDSEGHIYIVDAHFENIQIFDEAGQLLMAFGREGQEPGKFSLPAGLAIGPDDQIWVADSGNRRLQVFEYIRTSS
jgi:DNA-binding beta-propeller fold protein YncE